MPPTNDIPAVNTRANIKKWLSILLLVLVILVIAVYFYIQLRTSTPQNPEPINTTNEPGGTVNEILAALRRSPVGVSMERKDDAMEAYGLAWDMYDRPISSDEGVQLRVNPTGAAYFYFIYTETCNIAEWLIEKMQEVNPEAVKAAFAQNKSPRIVADVLMRDMLLRANDEKEDRFNQAAASYLITRTLNESITTQGTTTIPEGYMDSIKFAQFLVERSASSTTAYTGVRLGTLMERDLMRSKMLLAMFGYYDNSKITDEYNQAVGEMMKARDEIAASGTTQRRLANSYNNEVALRISYASYLWIMNKNKEAILPEVKAALSPMFTEVYIENARGTIYGISAAQERNSYVPQSLTEMATMYPELKTFLTERGWVF